MLKYRTDSECLGQTLGVDGSGLLRSKSTLSYRADQALHPEKSPSNWPSTPVAQYSPNLLTSAPPKEAFVDLHSPQCSLTRPIVNSPTSNQTQAQTPNNREVVKSNIKIYAYSLSQDVEYITVPVTTQIQCQQIVKFLLRKFRLKHRDPNLFYLTLERWIRKDGLKYRSVMLLNDDACPLQMQQCCSNPPHNDIKFSLQTRSGALIKIHCSDVVPDAMYKCLSLSTQTTVEQTIELMLHCLNLTNSSSTTSSSSTSNTNHNSAIATHRSENIFGHVPEGSVRSQSPESTTDSNDSSSSGIESDFNANCASRKHRDDLDTKKQQTFNFSSPRPIESGSRAGSFTSLSSGSNMSQSSSTVPTDQYYLVIECQDLQFGRTLEPYEYLVDVYQSLLAEAKALKEASLPRNAPLPPQDQWFLIRLKRRIESILPSERMNEASILNRHNTNSLMRNTGGQSKFTPDMIKIAIPRPNLSNLPPVPTSLMSESARNNNKLTEQVVSEAQIEVNINGLGSNQKIRDICSKGNLVNGILVPSNPPQIPVPGQHSPPNLVSSPLKQNMRPEPETRTSISNSGLVQLPTIDKYDGVDSSKLTNAYRTTPHSVPVPVPQARSNIPGLSNSLKTSQVVASTSSPQSDKAQLVSRQSLQNQFEFDGLPAPPPPQFIILPSLMMQSVSEQQAHRQRSRNLSDASSTFGRSGNSTLSRQRNYDPNQLAADLLQLEMKCPDIMPPNMNNS